MRAFNSVSAFCSFCLSLWKWWPSTTLLSAERKSTDLLLCNPFCDTILFPAVYGIQQWHCWWYGSIHLRYDYTITDLRWYCFLHSTWWLPVCHCRWLHLMRWDWATCRVTNDATGTIKRSFLIVSVISHYHYRWLFSVVHLFYLCSLSCYSTITVCILQSKIVTLPSIFWFLHSSLKPWRYLWYLFILAFLFMLFITSGDVVTWWHCWKHFSSIIILFILIDCLCGTIANLHSIVLCYCGILV